MRKAITALFILTVASSTAASADSCRDRFIELFSDRAPKGPVKIHVTQEIKGGMSSKNYNYQSGTGDWMTEMIEPDNMQWTLVHDNVMYSSADKGKSWKKIRALDSNQNESTVKKDLADAAATVKNAECGNETLDGVMHKTVAADYDYPKYKSTHRDKYWVNPKTGWITKSVMQTKQSGFESTTTQVIEPAPGLELPTPGAGN
jgi:hypothetical protein